MFGTCATLRLTGDAVSSATLGIVFAATSTLVVGGVVVLSCGSLVNLTLVDGSAFGRGTVKEPRRKVERAGKGNGLAGSLLGKGEAA